VHRHFPTKEALVAAVVTDRLAGLAARAAALADAVEPKTGQNAGNPGSDGPDSGARDAAKNGDATAAFAGFLAELTAEASHNVTLTSSLGGAGIGADGAAAAAALGESLGRLLELAQRDGGVRADLTVPDLHAILGGVIAMERNLAAEHRGIGLSIVIDGLTARRG
jgi:AcrR family transcriptional regulator